MQNDYQINLVHAYSGRMSLCCEPNSSYLADIAALLRFDVIVRQDDEFFIADAFRLVLESAAGSGAFHMVQGRGHLDVLFAPETLQIITSHLRLRTY